MRRVALHMITLVQAVLGARVILRLIRTASGARITSAPENADGGQRVSVLVPVLNEEHRLGPCLERLIIQDRIVSDIIVVDGGSCDGTLPLVQQFTRRDPRIRLVQAGPPPQGQNGKAWQLAEGLRAADGETSWVLTVDADIRPEHGLVEALVRHAQERGIAALSVATRQRVSSAAEGLIHPSMLTTLVYRFGIPGQATTDPEAVQANGQCFLARRDVLTAIGGFERGLDAIAEDVAIARSIASAGYSVGFYEADGLVQVEMYANAVDAWRNWSRSLPLVDRRRPWPGVVGLAEVLLVQAAPPWLLACSRGKTRSAAITRRLNFIMTAVRLGVLGGTVRAYTSPPPTYWLSPMADLPVALTLVAQSIRRRHTWRGRILEVI